MSLLVYMSKKPAYLRYVENDMENKDGMPLILLPLLLCLYLFNPCENMRGRWREGRCGWYDTEMDANMHCIVIRFVQLQTQAIFGARFAVVFVVATRMNV